MRGREGLDPTRSTSPRSRGRTRPCADAPARAPSMVSSFGIPMRIGPLQRPDDAGASARADERALERSRRRPARIPWPSGVGGRLLCISQHERIAREGPVPSVLHQRTAARSTQGPAALGERPHRAAREMELMCQAPFFSGPACRRARAMRRALRPIGEPGRAARCRCHGSPD